MKKNPGGFTQMNPPLDFVTILVGNALSLQNHYHNLERGSVAAESGGEGLDIAKSVSPSLN
jgi:hypothetical protein